MGVRGAFLPSPQRGGGAIRSIPVKKLLVLPCLLAIGGLLGIIAFMVQQAATC